MSIHGAVGGVVKEITKVPVTVGGVVKEAASGVCGVGGVVRTFYQNKLVVFADGAFQNGFSLSNSGTGRISDGKLWDPYDSDADGIIMMIKPDSFNPSHYSKLCLDMYFDTVSYCGGPSDSDGHDTDFAYYFIRSSFGVFSSVEYYARKEISVGKESAKDRRVLEIPIIKEASTHSDYLFQIFTRCNRNKTYAATPSTYYYKIWFE